MRTVMTALAVAAFAQAGQAEQVAQSRPAAAGGTVVIECPGGSVQVVGWDKPEVAVSGTLGPGAERVELRGSGRDTTVEVIAEAHPHQASATLQVRVPATSRLQVESFGAAIAVSGVTGAVKAENINGSIEVAGPASQVSVESVNGRVTVRGRSPRIHAESVNGSVTVSEAGDDVEASTVNGSLSVTSTRALRRGRLETVNGTLRLEGELEPKAMVDLETVAGRVVVALAAGTPAEFDISTFTGRIDNQLGPAAENLTERTSSDEGPGRQVRFAVGGGGARITVRTLSGGVSIVRAGDARHD